MSDFKKNQGSKNSPKKRKTPDNRTKKGKTVGGAPRKYTKSKTEHQKQNEIDPIPGNQEWGGLARKGVLRVRHDDLKALEEQNESRSEEIPEIIDPEIEILREARAKRKEEPHLGGFEHSS